MCGAPKASTECVVFYQKRLAKGYSRPTSFLRRQESTQWTQLIWPPNIQRRLARWPCVAHEYHRPLVSELTASEDAGEERATTPLQRGVLVRVPLLPLVVCVEPFAQAVKVIAERGDLGSFTLPIEQLRVRG